MSVACMYACGSSATEFRRGIGFPEIGVKNGCDYRGAHGCWELSLAEQPESTPALFVTWLLRRC